MPDVILKQQYIHPPTNIKYSREMRLDVDNIRPENSNNINSKIMLNLVWWGHYDNNLHPDSKFTPVCADPEELIFDMLEAKRTTSPMNCMRSFLIEKADKGSKNIIVQSTCNKTLNASEGDPIVILNNLNGTQKTYAIISEINDNKITLSNPLLHNYFSGAFVQNLSNRWHKETDLGAKSQISRPVSISMWAEYCDGFINVGINEPVNLGNIQFYDLYVRNQPFTKLEAHWIPDVLDFPIKSEDNIHSKTYNGGEQAGGGKLKAGTYYVALISKDKSGRINVNESPVTSSATKIIELH